MASPARGASPLLRAPTRVVVAVPMTAIVVKPNDDRPSEVILNRVANGFVFARWTAATRTSPPRLQLDQRRCMGHVGWNMVMALPGVHDGIAGASEELGTLGSHSCWRWVAHTGVRRAPCVHLPTPRRGSILSVVCRRTTIRPRSSASPTGRLRPTRRWVTDGLASYDAGSLGARPHEAMRSADQG